MEITTTKLALKVFYDTSKERDSFWENASSQLDIVNAEKNDNLALRKVQEAFYTDTKSINALENCYRIPIKFIELLCRKYD